jgi:hypothetical protein
MTQAFWQHLADVVLVLHLGVVVFVIGGLVAVVAGNLRGWPWVNRTWFRVAHLTAIGIVVLQTWLGQVCPLTALESWLREKAGGAGYTESFVEHWIQRVLFYDAPFWVFTVAYTVFGLLVVAAWMVFPARSRDDHMRPPR